MSLRENYYKKNIEQGATQYDRQSNWQSNKQNNWQSKSYYDKQGNEQNRNNNTTEEALANKKKYLSYQATTYDKFNSEKKWDQLLRNILFDDDPKYKMDDYIKGLPSDIGNMNSIELRVNKMKYDKYYFAPNFHRIALERICNTNDASLWLTLSNLVISLKCINFPLVYFSQQVTTSDKWKLYFERMDHKNVLTSISNKEILLQVALIFYNMYKNRVWCQTPTFDMFNITKTKVTFKVRNMGFIFEISRIVTLSSCNVIINMQLHESAYLDLFLSIVDKQMNHALNRPYHSFIEFFLFEFYDKIVPQVLQPLKTKATEITSPSIISSLHSPGTFVQFKYFEKIYNGILLERLSNGLGEKFDNCIIAYFNENIEIALKNEQEVYIANTPPLSFLGITVGE